MKTFKYRFYPDKQQQTKLWSHANKLNNIYNYFLDQRIEFYKENKKIGIKEQQAELVLLKKSDPILSEIHSQVLQQVILRLDKAYKNFFRRNKLHNQPSGFPKFRSCKDFFGICYPQLGYSIKNNIFHTKVYGNIIFNKHRDYKGNIRQIYITCDVRQHWFISITTDYINENLISKDQTGIDIGLTNLVVDTNGMKIKNCTHAKYFDKQIDKLKNKRDKNYKKGSRRYKKLNKIIRRLYGVKTRKINDFQHKVSKNLSRKYDTIFVENLSVKTMSEGVATGLNKAIRNSKLAQFISFLDYKVNNLVKVNPVNTSKTCNNCGNINHNLKLSDRNITCSKCGNNYDRDENAAKNIFCLEQAIISGLCTELDTIQKVIDFRREQFTHNKIIINSKGDSLKINYGYINTGFNPTILYEFDFK